MKVETIRRVSGGMVPWENFRNFGLHWSVFHVVFIVEKKNMTNYE